MVSSMPNEGYDSRTWTLGIFILLSRKKIVRNIVDETSACAHPACEQWELIQHAADVEGKLES